MDFALTDSQEELLRSVGRWVERSWRSGTIDTVRGRRTLWAELVANGWTSLLSPTADELPALDAALVVERLAYGGCTLAVGASAMIAPFLVELADLDPPATVDQLLVLDDPDVGTPFARGLEIADRIVVLRATAGRLGRQWFVGAVSVEDASPTVVLDEGRTMLSRVDSVERASFVEVDPVAGELAWLIGAVLSAAELIGLAQAVLDDCVAYAKIRVQGGKPIGGHQAIQHRLANMLGDIERARYLTYQAATVVGRGATTEVHQAKALAARDCLAAIRSAHQVMGAIGYSAEHQLHHFHKQAIIVAHEFGSANAHWAALEATA